MKNSGTVNYCSIYADKASIMRSKWLKHYRRRIVGTECSLYVGHTKPYASA